MTLVEKIPVESTHSHMAKWSVREVSIAGWSMCGGIPGAVVDLQRGHWEVIVQGIQGWGNRTREMAEYPTANWSYSSSAQARVSLRLAP